MDKYKLFALQTKNIFFKYMCSDCFQTTPFIRPRLLIQLTTSFTVFAVLNPFCNTFYKNF